MFDRRVSHAGRNGGLDAETLRRTEFARLDAAGHAYLDYTGAALHAASQAHAHGRRLATDVLGNPHSENPAARESTARMERARRRVLAFFRADPDVYDVVFTANATAAVHRIAESYPFSTGSQLVLTADNHNSVNGLRCFGERAGAEVRYVRLNAELRAEDPQPLLVAGRRSARHLFAFPAQSNFSGVRHPLTWVDLAAANGFDVLLDAAAYAPTHRLRLDRVRPAFVVLSFYKMFGLPTGLGALIARHDALARLRRPWFAGGTVDWVSTQDGTHALRDGAHGFEDGTPNFHAFDDVCDGLDLLDRIGMRSVGTHVAAMTRRLLDGLIGLGHGNGRPVARIHGPVTLAARGGTVAFNVQDAEGSVVPYEDVVERAGRRGVSVRGGCFCNPGCAEAALGFTADRAASCRDRLGGAFSIPRFADCMGGPVGAVRASVGVPTVPSDIERLLDVLRTWVGARVAA